MLIFWTFTFYWETGNLPPQATSLWSYITLSTTQHLLFPMKRNINNWLLSRGMARDAKGSVDWGTCNISVNEVEDLKNDQPCTEDTPMSKINFDVNYIIQPCGALTVVYPFLLNSRANLCWHLAFLLNLCANLCCRSHTTLVAINMNMRWS